MSVQLMPPSKRPYDRGLTKPKGKGKRQKLAAFSSHNMSLKIPPGSTVFRFLCPASKIGSVIGKGGKTISQIRQETGVKVRVEETVPGCDEREIFIVGSDKENGVGSEQNEEEDDEKTTAAEEVDNANEHGEDKKSVPMEDLESEKGTSSVQKALLLVFEKTVEGDLERETDVGDEGSNKSSTSVARLLVFSSQVGCLVGKDGTVIKQMYSESGVQIQILPRDKLPVFASSSDELVQISGGVDEVRKALQSVSQLLLENPPQDYDSVSAKSSGASSHSFGHHFSKPEAYPSPNYHFPAQGAPYVTGPRDGESGIPGLMNPSQDVITFRLLCPSDKVGGVIGKGGTIVKSLQHETGCEINVLKGISDLEDRIIVISGPAHPDDKISAAQDAVLRVQSRIARAVPESKEKNVMARLLVSSNQIGCLLGKGGAIIAEMRKFTGASIRVGKDKIPNYASENEELVQINGELVAVEEALLQITTRLRNHFFRDAFPSLNHPSIPTFPDQGPPFPSFMGRREFSPPGMHSSLGPPFHNFNAGDGFPPHDGFHPHDGRPPFMHNIHRPGFPPHISERMPSSAPRGPQELIEGGGPIGLPDYAGVPRRRIGGFGGGSHPAIITNTTVEVVVPRSVVPVIYGEDGGCLKQIREISDAKITITEPKPGATETMIIISGTPEETNAAQSLIQAFVISESEAS